MNSVRCSDPRFVLLREHALKEKERKRKEKGTPRAWLRGPGKHSAQQN
jgi:hypothetical protein